MLLAWVAFQFLATLNRYQDNCAYVETLEVRLRMATDQQQELRQKRKALAQAKRFLEGAKAAGLSRNRWKVYPVAIDDALNLAQARTLIEQCTASPNVYFKPGSLHLRRLGEDNQPLTLATDIPADTAGLDATSAQQGDLFMRLRGSFLVGGES
jgi:type II secretory pathway pseudopilin PulG